MAKSELYEKGERLRSELFGEDFAQTMDDSTYQDPVMQKFREVATEIAFGTVWSRPGLDLKTRTLVCVVSDVSGGREPELALHLRMALRQGWTEEELTEVLLHLAPYVGLPLVRESMLVASRVYSEFREDG